MYFLLLSLFPETAAVYGPNDPRSKGLNKADAADAPQATRQTA
jgi:hypothetical protein